MSRIRTIDHPARTAAERAVVDEMQRRGSFANVEELIRTALREYGRRQFALDIPAHVLCTGPARRRP